VLAHDLAHPHGGHDPVPFLCLSDSNTEARVMYEAGVRYVIQSESLAVCFASLAVLIDLSRATNIRTFFELDGMCMFVALLIKAGYALALSRESVICCRILLPVQGRAIRRQMHYQQLDKQTFMKEYVELHKADMDEEEKIPQRKKLARFL